MCGEECENENYLIGHLITDHNLDGKTAELLAKDAKSADTDNRP